MLQEFQRFHVVTGQPSHQIFFVLHWTLIKFIMFLKTLVHPHKKCFGRVGIECILLGKPNLHVVVFLEVGQNHLNSILSHVLSKKFTCVFNHEGPTLSLWDIG